MISVATHEAQPQVSSIQVQAAEVTKPGPTIFRSKFPDISITNHLPLHNYCFEKVSEFPDNPCLISGATGKIYSYAETHLLCRQTAAGLAKLGVKQNDVVFLLLSNCPEFAFLFFAASMLGAATTAANPFYKPAEIHKQFNSSGAKVIVTHSANVDKLRDESFPRIGDELTVVTVDEPPEGCVPFSEVLSADEKGIPEVVIDAEDAVAIPFSSGTTGWPKGVVLTHKSLISSVAQQVDGDNPNLYMKTEDVVLCVLPLFHIFSLNSVLLCGLRAGAAVLIMSKFEIGTMLEQIQRHRVTLAEVVPPIVLALAKNPAVDKYDLSSIRLVLSGGAPLGKDLLEAVQQKMPQAVLGQVTSPPPLSSTSSFFFSSLVTGTVTCFYMMQGLCWDVNCGTVVTVRQMDRVDISPAYFRRPVIFRKTGGNIY